MKNKETELNSERMVSDLKKSIRLQRNAEMEKRVNEIDEQNAYQLKLLRWQLEDLIRKSKWEDFEPLKKIIISCRANNDLSDGSIKEAFFEAIMKEINR